jgi:arsenite transporter
VPVSRSGSATRTNDAAVVAKLSTLDRFLPVWILFAMGLGLGLGRLIPGLDDILAKVAIGGISLPIAVGLLVMMYPVLAKVRYDKLDTVTGDRKLMISSLVMNWLVGPAVMFALAWIFLPDLPEYRTGLIIVGLARCIAMVIIWNDLACGDREAAAVLVALNSIFQVLAFGLLGWFYLDILPGWLGLGDGQDLQISALKIAVNVIIFLGVPLLFGFLTRRLGEKKLGRSQYENVVLPRLGPWALYGLLFTIVILFALQGKTITSQPGDVARIALPLLVYFAVMVRRLRAGPNHRPAVRPNRNTGVHRSRKQLRTGDRSGHRHIRRHVRPGAVWRRRTTDRSARPRRPRLRVTRISIEARKCQEANDGGFEVNCGRYAAAAAGRRTVPRPACPGGP